VGKATREVRRRNPELRVLLSVGGVRVPTEVVEALVKSADRRTAFASSVARNVRDAGLNGVEVDFRLDARGVSKQSKGGLVALAKVWLFGDHHLALCSSMATICTTCFSSHFHIPLFMSL
jgi:hypothetical protein